VTLDYTIAPDVNVELGILSQYPTEADILSVFQAKNYHLVKSQFKVEKDSMLNDGIA